MISTRIILGELSASRVFLVVEFNFLNANLYQASINSFV